MRKTLTYAVLPLAVAAGAVAAIAGPASAVASTCKTATTTLTDRPDSGLHGDWAKDAITRTVKLCEAVPGVPGPDGGKSTYIASVADTGTFTTVAGKSPNAGVTLPAGIVGKLAGGYTATFTATPAFATYQHVFDGKTYSGTAPSTTGDWVAKLWGGEDFTSVTNLGGWTWTYWTCSVDLAKATEKFVNAEAGNAGDITGIACPTVAPVVLPTVSASPSASPSTGGTAAGLPVTGSQTGLLAAGGAVLLAAGAGLVLLGRRRKNLSA
jgi:LPXTG-motif cell wall-anchored protein